MHKRGVPVIYYVSPQLWAWKQGRIERVRKYVRKMLRDFSLRRAVLSRARHRSAVRRASAGRLACAQPSRESNSPLNTILTPAANGLPCFPGSRRAEVSRIFPTLLEAAQLLGPDYVYIVPVASTLDPRWMSSFLRDHAGPPITFISDARATLLHARAAAVASGTSTLEAALIGTPFTMVYQVAPLTWKLGRRLVKVDRFAMVNLIAERDVVPELGADGFHGAASVRRVAADNSRW